MLPSYLQMKTHAAADGRQTVICGDVRFTVLTSRLLRLERGNFTDDATLVVIDRSFAHPSYTVKEQDGMLFLQTEHLQLSYRIGEPFSAENLCIRLLCRPYTEWHYGDKPLHNLGGTVETLDQINGACPLADGICAVDGFATVEDSRTALLLPDGWFAPREEGTEDLYFFGYGHDYTACVQDFYRLTGRTELLPAYALGNWWSRYYKYTEDSYLRLMDAFREKDIPLSVGIVDMDWHLTDGDGREYVADGWTGYTWNRTYFPSPKRFLDGLHQRHLRTALNLHPAAGVRRWEEQYPEMAVRMGVEPASGKPVPFNCLSQEFWSAYFEVLHFPKEREGVDFWWMDWQQGNDYSWIHPFDPTVQELECLSPLWMLNHMHFLAAKREGRRGLIFSRFAGLGSQRYPIGFSGDSIISWETLAFQPYFTVTASNVGYGFWSHDLGGHMAGCRDDELNTRWIQFGVFSPIFRTHSADSPFTGREPWNFNKRAEWVITDFMRLRHRLFPYLYTMCYRNYEELLPLMRPMYHTHPEEPGAYEVANEYWFGSELIVSPITSKADAVSDRGSASVWLPEGRWIDFFTGYVYMGGETLEVYRPLEQMPLFCKAGAIIPMQAHVPQDNRLGGCQELEIVIAAGASNLFVLYEDDGETLAYQNEEYCKTALRLSWSEQQAVFTVYPTEGELSLIPAGRNYTMFFKGFAEGCTFCTAEGPLPAVYDRSSNSYTVHICGVRTDTGVSVTINRDGALLHDDCDYAERVIDLLTRAQCEMSYKNTWHWVMNTVRESGIIDHAQFVNGVNNQLPGAIFEYLHQVFRKKKAAPTPGIPSGE